MSYATRGVNCGGAARPPPLAPYKNTEQDEISDGPETASEHQSIRVTTRERTAPLETQEGTYALSRSHHVFWRRRAAWPRPRAAPPRSCAGRSSRGSCILLLGRLRRSSSLTVSVVRSTFGRTPRPPPLRPPGLLRGRTCSLRRRGRCRRGPAPSIHQPTSGASRSLIFCHVITPDGAAAPR